MNVNFLIALSWWGSESDRLLVASVEAVVQVLGSGSVAVRSSARLSRRGQFICSRRPCELLAWHVELRFGLSTGMHFEKSLDVSWA